MVDEVFLHLAAVVPGDVEFVAADVDIPVVHPAGHAVGQADVGRGGAVIGEVGDVGIGASSKRP